MMERRCNSGPPHAPANAHVHANGNRIWPKIAARKWLRLGLGVGSPRSQNFNADSDAEESPKPSAMLLRGDSEDAFWTDCVDRYECKIFVGTWNVGGMNPQEHVDLDEWLDTSNDADIYVIGFQEVVPLKAGRVIGPEDNRAGHRWDSIIRNTLNRKPSSEGGISRSVSAPSRDLSSALDGIVVEIPDGDDELRAITVTESLPELRHILNGGCGNDGDKDSSKHYSNSKDASPSPSPSSPSPSPSTSASPLVSPSTSRTPSLSPSPSPKTKPRYRRVASKQMVGIFITVWVKTHLRRHVRDVSVSCVGCGIMNLGNKGSVSVSMKLDEASFCFVCSHLASGEKEGDELRRNADIAEILKRTNFSSRDSSEPKTIVGHDRIVWLGDLNYRLSLQHCEAMAFIDQEDWERLLLCDQLKIEQKEGRIFQGWQEGQIDFAPTYKYAPHSDHYSGVKAKSGERRRVPAWCDRILWYGKSLQQLSYKRSELRQSDHRPVAAMFITEVEGINSRKLKKKMNLSFKLMEAQEVLDKEKNSKRPPLPDESRKSDVRVKVSDAEQDQSQRQGHRPSSETHAEFKEVKVQRCQIAV